MTATDSQVRIAMRERKDRVKVRRQAAAKANLGTRKTVSKYEKAVIHHSIIIEFRRDIKSMRKWRRNG